MARKLQEYKNTKRLVKNEQVLHNHSLRVVTQDRRKSNSASNVLSTFIDVKLGLLKT